VFPPCNEPSGEGTGWSKSLPQVCYVDQYRTFLRTLTMDLPDSTDDSALEHRLFDGLESFLSCSGLEVRAPDQAR
jgi:hypothetical protein